MQPFVKLQEPGTLLTDLMPCFLWCLQCSPMEETRKYYTCAIHCAKPEHDFFEFFLDRLSGWFASIMADQLFFICAAEQPFMSMHDHLLRALPASAQTDSMQCRRGSVPLLHVQAACHSCGRRDSFAMGCGLALW